MGNARKNEALFWPVIWDKKWLMLLGILTMLVGTVLSLLSPWVMRTLIDDVIPRNKLSLLSIYIPALILLPVVATAFTAVQTFIFTYIGGETTDHLRAKVIAKILRLSPRVLNNMTVGDLVHRITRVCGMIGDVYVANQLLPSLTSILTFLGTFAFMLYLNFRLTLVSLSVIPLAITSARLLGSYVERNMTRSSALITKGQSFFTELVSGIKTVQLFAQNTQEQARADEWRRQQKPLRTKTSIANTFYRQVLSVFIQSLAIGIVFSTGVYFIVNHVLTLGILIAFMMYVPQLYSGVNSIQGIYVWTKNINPTLKQMRETFLLSPELSDRPNARPVQDVKGTIEFRDVSFQYQNDRSGLHHISFKIDSGEFLGIVGPTGGGKSTILELITRFLDPDTGSLFIDGTDIRDYQLADLRRNIAVVSQDVFLWNRSLRDNLSYGSPQATEDEIKEVARIVQMGDFINALPQKYDTIVGERGVHLSGGERQRISIAQAILRHPQILLLDEPSSALDANTEQAIQQYVEKLFHGKTLIVVAHRLITVRHASKIIVVQNGTIIEQGSHQDLMNAHGVYQEMCLKQQIR
ncbi:ABC transporter ATP-binding protein [Sporolactobacillus pectinivorans]|uniref:ABC transporter ATP-binding protein n=1 Tax=Sporolactobacillus pectinivorans TaxID=1591408 RepID=UPI00138FAEF6|nr:ABC transporter ATP-binding protein [Sporolactobacillus pectinivorans]